MQKQHAETVAEEEVLELEDIASCQICKDVLKSPMLLPCGHTYCSLCIQRWLGEKRYCPTCREEFDQHHALLRKNIALGQIIEALTPLRVRLAARMQHPTGDAAAARAAVAKLEAEQNTAGAHALPQKITGKYNYQLESLNNLRKLCKDIGITVDGVKDKSVLIHLHKEFVLRFNAECDAFRPKPEETIRRKVSQPAPAITPAGCASAAPLPAGPHAPAPLVRRSRRSCSRSSAPRRPAPAAQIRSRRPRPPRPPRACKKTPSGTLLGRSAREAPRAPPPRPLAAAAAAAAAADTCHPTVCATGARGIAARGGAGRSGGVSRGPRGASYRPGGWRCGPSARGDPSTSTRRAGSGRLSRSSRWRRRRQAERRRGARRALRALGRAGQRARAGRIMFLFSQL